MWHESLAYIAIQFVISLCFFIFTSLHRRKRDEIAARRAAAAAPSVCVAKADCIVDLTADGDKTAAAGESEQGGNRLTRYLSITKPNDGLYTVHEWGVCCNTIISTLFIFLSMIPSTYLGLSAIFGMLLAKIEGWQPHLGFDYVLWGLGLIPTYNPVYTPKTKEGDVVTISVVILCFLFGNLVLGLTANMKLVAILSSYLPKSRRGFYFILFILIPVLAVICALLFGLMLTAMNDWDFRTGFFFMSDLLFTGYQLGLVTPVFEPHWYSKDGKVEVLLFYLLGQLLSGMVLGIVGMHPIFGDLMSFLEGAYVKPELDELCGVQSQVKNLEEELAAIAKHADEQILAAGLRSRKAKERIAAAEARATQDVSIAQERTQDSLFRREEVNILLASLETQHVARPL